MNRFAPTARRSRSQTPFLVLALALAAAVAAAADKPFGIERRVPWTTSQIVGSPEPPAPYRTTRAFSKLKFNEPLAMTAMPGTNRLVVTERFGRVLSFRNEPNVAQTETLLELDKKVIYGLEFHPRFASNGYFYATVVDNPDNPDPDKLADPKGTRVSRYRVQRDNPLAADPASEKVIIEWPSGGHNGGCLKFGPDGMLYIATGDSSGIADEYLTGQDLSELSGAILRIDVDHEEEGRAYSIPKDNPFVGAEGARGEVWAYGLRQPWQMSFDRATGDLWTGNVGQDLWEQVFLIERGGNYGWSVMEGSHPFRPERPRGPTPFVAPIVEHDHAEFRSITGGFVYHGQRIPALRGSYIYADYDTGKIWMLRYDRDAKKVTQHAELVDSTLRVVAFGEDPAGELYLVDHMSGLIQRLEPNPSSGTVTDFPRKLSETGLFASTARHEVAAGLIPYDVIAPQWIDGASKVRYLGLPGDSQIEFDGITYPQPAPDAPHGWKFPNGTVAMETISIEIEPGVAASRRKLETRILHYEKLDGTEEVGDQFWRGYTYVWNDAQTDATLVDEVEGRDLVLTLRDAKAEGGQRTQTWHVPGRAECTVCHNMAAKYALGINTLQMNRDFAYPNAADNQLRTFQHLGLFEAPLPDEPSELPRLTDYRDASRPLDERARSYLHANCSHCHRKWGGGNTEFRLLSTVPLGDTGIAGVKPAHGAFYMTDARIIAPGKPTSSVLLYRLAKLGPGRMPRIGSSVVDTNGLQLIHDWIASLPAEGRPADDRLTERLAQLRPRAGDARRAALDEMLATTGGALRLLLHLPNEPLAEMRDEIVARAVRPEAEPHVRELFERFLPEEQRPKRLGASIKPEQILAIAGDRERGRRVFMELGGVQCKSCHKISGQGADVGPELTQVGKKYQGDRARILDTILNPSKEIDPQFRVYLVQTEQGKVHTGLLVKKDGQEVILKDAKNQLTRIAADEVAEMVPQQQSMMPELLLRDLTAEQVADLTEFLSSLK